MPVFTCRAILFDLDGVLVDSTPSGSRVWRAWALEHGLDPEHVIHIGHGRPTAETVRLVVPHLDASAQAHLIEQREIDDVDGLTALPGARELLLSLPPDRYTIVTSGSRRLATTRLKAAGLPIPPALVTADDILRGKPDPEPYRKGAGALGVAAEDCLVFEDAPSGVRAAVAAGAVAIGIPTTYPAEELTAAAAKLIIPSLLCVRAQMDAGGDSLRVTIGGGAVAQTDTG